MKFLTSALVAISISVLAFCSYYLYRELTSRVEKKGGEVIGTITFKKKNASRRYTDSVIWEEIAQESEIYNYDAIRTMEYSSAILTLKDGTKIELDQNTMLVVVMGDKGLNINFDSGGVTAQNTSGSQGPITLNSKDASISLAGGDISVNSGDEGTSIHLNSGSATVAAGGKELGISQNESAMLKGGVAESRKTKLTPESPKHNSYIVSFGRSRPVTLSWKSDVEGEVKVEVSMNNRFRPVLKNFTTKKSTQQVELPAGDYYWRIVKGDTSSHPVKFTILSDRKPEPSTPYMNQHLTLTEGSELVTFRWDKSQYAVSYEITAAKNRDMTDPVLNLSSKINTISTSKLEAGTYYWTVKSIYPPGIISDPAVTVPNIFTVEKRMFSLLKPVPLDQGSVPTGSPFTLNWKGVQGAKSYRVELASDDDFRNIIVSKTTASTFIKISEKLAEGKYYWRVSAVSGQKISEASDTALLTITGPVEISLISPAPGSVLYDKPETVTFSWSDPNRGDRYIIEISARRDFRFLKAAHETSSSSIKISNPGEGSYYWRVRLKDRTGKTIAQSSTADFTIPADMKAPVLIAPGNNEKIIPGIIKRLRLQWEKIEGASEYEVEIFQRIAGIDKSMSIYSVKSSFIDLSNQMLYKPGQFGWLVRAKKTKGGKVTASRESKKSYFEIEAVELLPAPVIKTPPVLFNEK
jgi:hypothetical protein